MRRALLTFAVALAIFAAFLLVIGPAELAAELAGTDLPVFAVGLVAVTGSLVAWSLGLRPLLADAGGHVGRSRLTVAYTAAMFWRQVLPLGAVGGPALTTFAVEREVEIGYDRTLAVVTVAEVLSTLASLTLAGVGVALLLANPGADAGIAVMVAAAAVFTVVLVLTTAIVLTRRSNVTGLLAGGTALLHSLVRRVSVRLADRFQPTRTRNSMGRFYETVDAVCAKRRMLAGSFLAHFVGWTFAAVPLYTSAVALDASVSLALVVLAVPTVGLVEILPLPGGLGGVEIALSAVLVGAGGLAAPVAAGVVVLYRLCTFWYLIVLGALASGYAAGGRPEPPSPTL